MPTVGTPARPDIEERAVDFMDWLQRNTKLVVGALAVVIVVGVAGYLYQRATVAKAQRAEQALLAAEQSMAAQNTPLAEADLQKVVNQYGGTAAGAQAALLLAQLHYDKGEYQKGIDALQKVSGKAGELTPDVDALLAAGYVQAGKPAEGAKHYQDAAEATRFAGQKAQYRADAARAYANAGDLKTALSIWQSLFDDADLGPEAHLRAGELEQKLAFNVKS